MKNSTFTNLKLSGNRRLSKAVIAFMGVIAFLMMPTAIWAQSPGTNCANPILVTSLPFSDSGNTADYGSAYNSTNVPPTAPGAITTGTGSTSYLNGDEAIYAFTSYGDGTINISADFPSSDWYGLWVFTGCPFNSTVGYHTNTSGDNRTVNGLPVELGETYYIVISTWPAPQSTTYSINITGDITIPDECTGTPTADAITGPVSACLDEVVTLMGSVNINAGIEYQWQSSLDGNTSWTDISGANNHTYSFTFEEAGYYRLVTTCVHSNEEAISPVHSITANAATECYCTPNAFSFGCSDDQVKDFQVNGENGTSIQDLATGCATGQYDDRTHLPAVEFNAGSTYTAYVTSDYSSSERAAVWIDFNGDGVFDPVNERAGVVSTNVATTLPGSAMEIEIPSTVVPGLTRMRVMVAFSGNPTNVNEYHPCNAGSSPRSYGEIHDYMVNLVVPTCSAPTDVVVTEVTDTTATVDWIEHNDAVQWDILYVEAGGDIESQGQLIEGTTEKPYTIENLVPGVDYDFYVRSICDEEDVSSWSSPLSYGYCEAGSMSAMAAFHISNVKLNTIDHNSGASSYSDFTHINTLLVPGATYTLTVTPTADSPDYAAKYGVWIDFNGNRSFFDPEDRVMDVSTGTHTSAISTFTVPLNAAPGETRMRVMLNNEDVTGPCDNAIQFGEVEDYSIVIGDAPDCVRPTNLTAQNVEGNTFELHWNDNNGSDFWDIEYGPTGFALGEGTLIEFTSDNPYYFDLDPEVKYDFYVRSQCDYGESDWSDVYTHWYCLDLSNPSGETLYINNVALEGINNASGAADYTDFTNLSTELSAGETYELTLSVGTANPLYYANYAVWIDFNNNMTYDDPGELVAISGYQQFTAGDFPMTISFEVPVDVDPVTTTMRVLIDNHEILGACNSFNGEAEEYTIIITDPPSCYKPLDVVATNISEGTLDLGWTERNNATAWEIEYGPKGYTPGEGTLVTDVDSNPYTVTFTPTGAMDFYVRSVCGEDDSSEWGGPYKLDYCVPSYTSSSDYLSAISSNGAVINVSYAASSQPNDGSQGYADATALPFEAYEGLEFNMSSTYVGGTNTVKVWVDWNNDLVFDDSSELMVNSYSSSATQNFSIEVPEGTPNGEYRMRVRSRFSTTPFNSCDSQSWGSAVDFTLTVGDIPSCDAPTGLAIDNITATSLDLEWTDNAEASEWEIEYGPKGFAHGASEATLVTGVTSSPATLTIVAGQEYDFYVRAICGVDNVSYWSPVYSMSYCRPTSQYTSDWLSSVTTTGALTNANYSTSTFPTSGYADATHLLLEAFEGQEFDVLATYNMTQSNGFAVWVDWNNDMEFQASERMDFYGPTSTAAATLSVTVPEGTPEGEYRMRVRAQFNAMPPACGQVNYGSAVDFTLTVIEQPPYDCIDLEAYFGDSCTTANNDPGFINDDCECEDLPGCDWTVTVSADLYGDEISWNLTDANNNVVLSGGDPDGTETKTARAEGPLSFFITNDGLYGDNTGSYSVSNGVEIVVQGTLPYGGATYTYNNLECEIIEDCMRPTGLYVDNITLASVDFGWTEVGDATEWDIEYGPAGFVQGSPDGILISGVTTTSYTLAVTAQESYDMYVRAVCSETNSSSWRGPYTFTHDYCDATSQLAPANFRLRKVSLNTINNTSGSALYSDFTHITTELVPGSTYTIGFEANMDGNYLAEIGVWIDYSQNLNFEHPEEMVVYLSEVGHSGTPTFSGSFTVPATAPQGTTRMRVMMSNDPIEGPCDTFAVGEVEDYGIIITEAPDCIAPSGLHATNINTATGDLDLNWTDNSGADAWEIAYVETGGNIGDATIVSASTNPFSFTIPDTSVVYDFYVRSMCLGDVESEWSVLYKHDYCIHHTTPQPALYISKVSVNTLNNTSGVDGYGDYRHLSTELAAGETYIVSLSSVGAQSTYGTNYGIWIDFNNNMSFDDPGELLYVVNDYEYTAGDSPVTVEITIPADADPTTTVMRVMMSNDDITGACGNFLGEVEDYTVIITPAPTCMKPTDGYASNITNTSADLFWTDNNSGVSTWNIEYGLAGTGLGNGTSEVATSMPHNVSLTDGEGTYEFYVQAVCDGDEESLWAGPFTFANVYCTPTSQNTSDWISSISTSGAVTDMSYTATSFPATGYANMINLPFEAFPGQEFDLTAVYNMTQTNGFAVWIDWNGDMTFDSTELVDSQGPSVTTTANMSVSVPLGTNLGQYRMRVRAQYNAMPPACGQINWGSAVDFTLTIVDAPACPPPSALYADNITPNSADIGWASNASEWNIEWGVAGFTQGTGTLVSGVTSNPYQLTGLTQNTQYAFYVQADCSIDESDWAGPYSFRTACDYAGLPYSLDFEDVTTPAIPNCTSVVNEGSGNLWQTASVSSYGFSSKVLRYSYNSSNNANTWFFTQGIEMEAGVDYVISYRYGGTGTTFPEKMKVAYGTSNIATAMTEQLADYPNINHIAVDEELFFNVPATGVYYFGFQAYSNSNEFYLHVDDIFIDVAPTCLEPTDLYADNITQTSAELGWTSDASAFNLEWGAAGFTQGSGTLVSGLTANEHSLSDLTANTAYEFYVQADCGGGDESYWAGPYSFRTECDVISVLPYLENFDTYGTGSDAFPACWERPVTYTSGSVWPSIVAANPTSAPNSLRFQSLPADPTYAVSPAFAEDINNLRVDFMLKREGPNSGTMEVGVMSDPFDLNTFELVQTIDPANYDHTHYVIDLNNTTLSGANNYIAFRHVSVSSAWYYWLDDFKVDLIPACIEPSNLYVDNITQTSADLGWTENGDATAWNIEYGEAGFDQGTGTTIQVTSNPYTVTGLDHSTRYEFYVQVDCSSYTPWIGPLSFTTECLPPTLLSTTPGSVCGEGEVTLEATADAGTITWYASETDVIGIGTGESFVTPWLTETTSFWVAAVEGVNGYGGKPAQTTGSGTSPSNWGLVFEASESFILRTVDVYLAGAAGTLIVDLTDSSGSILDTRTIALPAGNSSSPVQHTIDLNFEIDPGDYRLIGRSGPSMVRDSSGNTYPYTVGDVATITSGYISGTSTTYYFFYNWYYDMTCSSDREEVIATVTDAPDFELSDDSLTICEGDTSDTVTINVGSDDYDTFEWTPSTGVSGSATTGWTFSPTESTTYVLEASQSSGATCRVVVELDVDVNPLPMSITAETSATSITTDEIATLSVSGNIANGTAVFGTGTTAPTATSWPNPFSAWWGGTKHQMLYTADELSAQGLIAGSVISAVTFDIAANTGGACVDFTIRMGATSVTAMTGLVSGTTNVYGPATFTPSTAGTGLVSFTLTTPYVWDGSSNLIVETVHNAGNGGNGSGTTTRASTTPNNSVYRVASDNVSGGIAGFDNAGSYSSSGAHNTRPNMTFTHSLEQTNITWSPADDLYTDAATTIPYVANDYAMVVYFKPTVAGLATYTATSHSDEGCSVSDSVQINVSQSGFDGFVYEDGAWTPEHPSGVSTSTDNIWVVNGTADGSDALTFDTHANNVTVMAGATLEVASILNLHGDLIIDGNLIFTSGEDYDGELGYVSPTSTITGEATVHRYFSDNRAFRMVSSAVSTSESVNANWQEGVNNPDMNTNLNPNPGYGTHITGSQTGANGFDATELGNPSMYSVDMANQVFAQISNTDNITLDAGDAYLLYVRGDRGIELGDNSASSSTILRSRGALLTGSQTQNFTAPAAGSTVMFGNPYQSAVDLNVVLGASTNVIPYYFFAYDPTIGDNGSYVTVLFHPAGYGFNTSNSQFNEYLQPGQAIQVMTLDPGLTTIEFTEAAKAPGNHTQTNIMDTRLRGDNMLTVQLYTTENFYNGGPVHDSFGMLFDSSFDNAITIMDAKKPMNFYENLGIDHDGTYLSLEFRNMPLAGEMYPLYTAGYTHTNYTMNMIVEGMDDYALYLDDHFTGTSTLLGQGEVSYNFAITSDPMSTASDRFSIRVEENFLGVTDHIFYGISLYPNPINDNTFYINAPKLDGKQVNVSLSDVSGRRVFESDLDCLAGLITVDSIQNLASGVYVVTLSHEGEKITFKLVKE